MLRVPSAGPFRKANTLLTRFVRFRNGKRCEKGAGPTLSTKTDDWCYCRQLKTPYISRRSVKIVEHLKEKQNDQSGQESMAFVRYHQNKTSGGSGRKNDENLTFSTIKNVKTIGTRLDLT